MITTFLKNLAKEITMEIAVMSVNDDDLGGDGTFLPMSSGLLSLTACTRWLIWSIAPESKWSGPLSQPLGVSLARLKCPGEPSAPACGPFFSRPAPVLASLCLCARGRDWRQREPQKRQRGDSRGTGVGVGVVGGVAGVQSAYRAP